MSALSRGITPIPQSKIYGGLGPVVLGVSWSLFTVATFLLILRYYVKFAMDRPGRWSLIWLTAAYIGGVAAQVCVTIGVKMYGIGNHLEVVLAAGTVSPAVLWVWITLFFALSCIGLGKGAAAALLISIQGRALGSLAKTFLWAIATLNVIMDAITMIALWFQCTPVHKLWDTTVPGSCAGVYPVERLGVTTGCINAASDVILALYPTYMIWKLNMPKRLKAGLCLLLSCGVFTGICAAIKTSKLPGMLNTTDPTYAIAPLVIWGLAEQWIVVIVSTVPPTYPIMQLLITRVRTSSGFSKGGSSRISRSHSKAVYLGSGTDHHTDDYSTSAAKGSGLRGPMNSSSHTGTRLGKGGGEVELQLRGSDTKTMKGRSYIDHSELGHTGLSEGSTADLPSNIVVMRTELTVGTIQSPHVGLVDGRGSGDADSVSLGQGSGSSGEDLGLH